MSNQNSDQNKLLFARLLEHHTYNNKCAQNSSIKKSLSNYGFDTYWFLFTLYASVSQRPGRVGTGTWRHFFLNPYFQQQGVPRLTKQVA
jgi:hypothetical protein